MTTAASGRRVMTFRLSLSLLEAPGGPPQALPHKHAIRRIAPLFGRAECLPPFARWRHRCCARCAIGDRVSANARRCWSNNTGASAGATLETRRGDFGRAATCAAGEALAFHPREVTDGQVTRQRPRERFRRRRVDAPALVSPRRAGAHRHAIRLRRRPMLLLRPSYRRPIRL